MEKRPVNCQFGSMDISSINGFSGGNLQATLANQLTSHTLGSSSHSAKSGAAATSGFAQLLSDASAAQSQAAKPPSPPSKVGSWLNAIVSLL
jgi:hypothetical protein